MDGNRIGCTPSLRCCHAICREEQQETSETDTSKDCQHLPASLDDQGCQDEQGQQQNGGDEKPRKECLPVRKLPFGKRLQPAGFVEPIGSSERAGGINDHIGFRIVHLAGLSEHINQYGLLILCIDGELYGPLFEAGVGTGLGWCRFEEQCEIDFSAACCCGEGDQVVITSFTDFDSFAIEDG